MAIKTCREGGQDRPEATSTQDHRRLPLNVRKHGLHCEFVEFCNQGHSKVTWTQSWAPGSGGLAGAGRGTGQRDLHKSLPTSTTPIDYLEPAIPTAVIILSPEHRMFVSLLMTGVSSGSLRCVRKYINPRGCTKPKLLSEAATSQRDDFL